MSLSLSVCARARVCVIISYERKRTYSTGAGKIKHVGDPQELYNSHKPLKLQKTK